MSRFCTGVEMILVCEQCGKQGTLDELNYSGKKLRLKCPYCSSQFIYAVPSNGNGTAVGLETVIAPGHALAPEPVAPPVRVVEDQLPDATIAAPMSALPKAEPAAPAMTSDPAVEAVINEAKRIARLIISEIKLYNQDKLAKMGTRKEILHLLKNDLVRGKQHYDSRIASRLPAGPDYFTETIKEILLAGKT